MTLGWVNCAFKLYNVYVNPVIMLNHLCCLHFEHFEFILANTNSSRDDDVNLSCNHSEPTVLANMPHSYFIRSSSLTIITVSVFLLFVVAAIQRSQSILECISTQLKVNLINNTHFIDSSLVKSVKIQEQALEYKPFWTHNLFERH